MVLSRFGEEVLLEALAIAGGSSEDATQTLRFAAPKTPAAPVRPSIPPQTVSSIRQDLERLEDRVSTHRLRVPAIDALAPDVAAMARCTELTRALQMKDPSERWPSVGGNDPNELDGNGASPLNMALLHPVQESFATSLLEAGAQPDAPDGNGVFPLEVAIAAQQKQKFAALKRAKIDGARRFEGGRTYLHLAVERRCTLAFGELKKRKVPIDAGDAAGLTALHYAAFVRGASELIKLKASPDVEDASGESAIGLATRGALASCQTGSEVEATFRGKRVSLTLEDGSVFARKGKGKPRRLKLADERIAARHFDGHRDFVRFVEAAVAMSKTADLEAATPSGESVLQRLADLRRPDFDKVLAKRGLSLPPPRAERPPLEAPTPPPSLTRPLNPVG